MNFVSSVGSQMQPYFEIAVEAFQTAFSSTGSFLSQIAQKVHAIWEAVLPYCIEIYVAFSQTEFSIIPLNPRIVGSDVIVISKFGTIASVAMGVLMFSGSALLFLCLVYKKP